jgi:hypothetical protein
VASVTSAGDRSHEPLSHARLVLAKQHASQFVEVYVGRRGIWQTVDLCNACERA